MAVREFRVVVSEPTLSRELRKMGYRKLSARPRHHAQPEGAIEDFKKASRAPGRDRREKGVDPGAHRGLVCRRSPGRPEEQDHPALGQARLASSAPKDQRTASTYIFGAISPKDGKGAALVMPKCDTDAMNLHLAEIATRVAPGAHAALLVDQAGWHMTAKLASRQTSPSCPCRPNARNSTRTRTSGSSCATTGCPTGVQILRRHRRPLLRRLEQARRSALAHHVHRTARLGPGFMISESWY